MWQNDNTQPITRANCDLHWFETLKSSFPRPFPPLFDIWNSGRRVQQLAVAKSFSCNHWPDHSWTPSHAQSLATSYNNLLDHAVIKGRKHIDLNIWCHTKHICLTTYAYDLRLISVKFRPIQRKNIQIKHCRSRNRSSTLAHVLCIHVYPEVHKQRMY